MYSLKSSRSLWFVSENSPSEIVSGGRGRNYIFEIRPSLLNGDSILKRTTLILVTGAFLALAGCNNPQSWQEDPYVANRTGDIWAPRDDWRQAEKNAKADWQNSLKDVHAEDCKDETCKPDAPRSPFFQRSPF